MFAVILVVASVAVAGAATVVVMDRLGKAPGKSAGPAANSTGSNNTTCAQDLATDGGGRMTMSVPLVGTMVVNTEVSDHFTMPAGEKKVDVNLSWDHAGWDLDLAIGTGDGPANGTVKASQNGVISGPVLLEYKNGGEDIDGGRWFVHAACNDPGSHRGENLIITYTVTAHHC
jgi:hypothetical protein